MVPVAMQGASSRMASNGPPFHAAASAVDGFGLQAEPREILRQALEPRRGTVDGRDMRAGIGELRGFSARRGAEVGDGFSFDVAEKTHRQTRGRVLHPPCAFFETGQCRDRTMRDQSHAAVRQHAAAETLRPHVADRFSR